MSYYEDWQLLIKQLSAVDPNTQCWNWQRSCSNGYGYIGRKELPTKQAHRLAYMAFNQLAALPIGLCVCHICDNRACVNPAHLTLQTKTWNNQDKVRKGRARTCNGQHINVGEAHPMSKLTASQVENIRQSDLPQTHLAKYFGVSQSAISRIKSGFNWRQQ